ncbi:MAG: sporulation membrane protein YtaF [Moorellales bacterium]
MTWPAILLCTLAVSVDALLAGMAYGVRNAVVPGLSLLVVALASVGAMACALSAGELLSLYLRADQTVALGALILLAMGLWILLETWFKSTAPKEAPYRVWRWRISSLGLVIQVMREPTRADLDRSGRLSLAEAALLGVALALDAFGVGIGAALAGMATWILPVAVGSGNLLFLPAGLWLGRRSYRGVAGPRSSYLAGAALILLAFWQVLRGGT